MKIFKLKYFLILIAFGLLGSCQVENVAFEAPEAIVTKKVPLPDGIPSEADDLYAFEKSQYYREGKLITDTIVIKDLLKDCKLLFVDGTRKEIYTTNQEAERFKGELNKKNNNNNKATASSDGDEYIQFFYEINRGYTNSDISYLFYFSFLGPQTTSTRETVNLIRYTKSGVQEPIYSSSNDYYFNFSDYLTGGYVYDVRYTINVINTTRYRRTLSINSDDGRYIISYIYPGVLAEYNGRHRSNGADKNFNGMGGFKIKDYSTQKSSSTIVPLPGY